MKFLKQFLDFYINTSLHVAVAVFALVQITKLELKISSDASIDFFIFFGTVFGYNFLKYYNIYKLKFNALKKQFPILLVSLIALIGMFFYFLKLDFSTQFSFLKIGILVLFYPFLRKKGLLKMFVVAFCIAYITSFIFTINQSLETIIIYFSKRFIIAITLLIPLEINDLEADSKTIFTIPQKIGIAKTKFLGYVLLLIFFLIGFLHSNQTTIIEIVIVIVIAFFIFFANSNRSKYYTSFWVESIPILWWLLLLIF